MSQQGALFAGKPAGLSGLDVNTTTAQWLIEGILVSGRQFGTIPEGCCVKDARLPAEASLVWWDYDEKDMDATFNELMNRLNDMGADGDCDTRTGWHSTGLPDRRKAKNHSNGLIHSTALLE